MSTKKASNLDDVIYFYNLCVALNPEFIVQLHHSFYKLITEFGFYILIK